MEVAPVARVGRGEMLVVEQRGQPLTKDIARGQRCQGARRQLALRLDPGGHVAVTARVGFEPAKRVGDL